MNIKQILSLLLFVVFTSAVVNAHALSHLFDSDFSSVEKCNTCDEYTLTGQDDEVFLSPEADTYSYTVSIYEVIFLLDFHSQDPEIVINPGKYYNKPPPFKLV